MNDFCVYPAIDVRDGRVVRLRQGDYALETRYPETPLAIAERYAQAGATWLHLVDLDAARAGGYTLAPLLRGIASATWNLPTGSSNLAIWLQGVGVSASPFPLQLSPIAGGLIR